MDSDKHFHILFNKILKLTISFITEAVNTNVFLLNLTRNVLSPLLQLIMTTNWIINENCGRILKDFLIYFTTLLFSKHLIYGDSYQMNLSPLMKLILFFAWQQQKMKWNKMCRNEYATSVTLWILFGDGCQISEVG